MVNPRCVCEYRMASAPQIAAFADPSGGAFHIGQWAWSHETQPDFCSGEVLWEMYFPNTGIVFAFRFDNSHEC